MSVYFQSESLSSSIIVSENKTGSEYDQRDYLLDEADADGRAPVVSLPVLRTPGRVICYQHMELDLI